MKKYKNIIIIIIINILIILLATKTNYFASTMDYINQHAIFPEYLRQTFYETKKLIPSLAINLGGGQNIYNIAYYGLLNPIILLSYLLPFIDMIDYLMITNIIILLTSSILFYKFIKNKYDEKISLFLTILFITSSPLIFHAHRQYMFIDYMPFLLLSLINIDKKKYINLTLDIFLIIMTSFYYSIPSIIVIIIYSIYQNKFNKKELISLLKSITIAVLLSAILTLPTLNAIINTREINNNINILSLIIPNINPGNLLYSSYSPGLTSIIIISIIYLLTTKEKQNKILSIILIILISLPICIYILNGGLYTRPKSLIPFIPILIMIIGKFINDLFLDKIDIKKLIPIIIISNLIILINYHNNLYYLDILLVLLLIIIYKKTKNKYLFIIPEIILSLVICINTNNNETYITREDYLFTKIQEEKIDTTYRTINLDNKTNNVNKTNNLGTSIYSSTINKYYKNLYHNIFKINNQEINLLSLPTTDNILFNKYMGVKYIITSNSLEYPYKYVKDNLYTLSTMPIGYATNKMINKTYYETLEYPYNIDIYMNNIITNDTTNIEETKIIKLNLDYTYELGNNIKLKENKLYVKEQDKIIVKLKQSLKNKLLFIKIPGQFEQDNNIQMTINNETNLLTKKNWTYPNNNNTFYYTLNNVDETLTIELSEGIYEVSNIETYILDEIEEQEYDEFIINKINSEKITGNIEVTNDGYFILKIPYDKGFKIKVNNENQKYELINDTFIGFKINKGYYDIEITYTPPYKNIGIIISSFGLIIFITSIYMKNKEKK